MSSDQVLMRRLAVLVPALLLASIAGQADMRAAAVSEGTTAVEVCGRLNEHRPATGSEPGQVTIGTRTFEVAPDTEAGNAGLEIAVGRELCVTARVGEISGQLVRYLFFPLPPDRQFCGNVLSSAGSSLTISADFGPLTLDLDEGLGRPGGGQRVCYVTDIGSSGDLVALRSEPVDTTNEREWAWPCGTVREYTPATASSPGSITVGSKTLSIAAGTAYTGDPAGDRTDRTAVGSDMCLRATLGDDRSIIEYLTSPMPTGMAVTAWEYTPPAGGRPGVIVLSYRTGSELRVPAEIAESADIGRDTLCFSVGVDEAGDAMATAIVPCEPGGAAGPEATASPPTAPTATLASPTPTEPTPSPTGVAVAAPSPSPTMPSGERPANAPLLAGAIALAALALAAVFLARRLRA